jgi:predicted metal-dependent HD superfamily phosphohydrolase
MDAWDRPGYHDLLHLEEVLDRLDLLAARGAGFDRTTTGLAAWFHDAVYDDAPGPEERSAQWAERELPAEVAPEVARLVRMTERHRPAADDPAGCALSDADLAILAAPADRYRSYVEGVRCEHADLSDADFRAGRRAVLVDLLEKPRLFHTPQAQALWEEAARANVTAEVEELGQAPRWT